MQMERAEIDVLVEGFRAAAAAAVSADVDGVELDAGPRGLLRQFHSNLTNHARQTGTAPTRCASPGRSSPPSATSWAPTGSCPCA